MQKKQPAGCFFVACDLSLLWAGCVPDTRLANRSISHHNDNGLYKAIAGYERLAVSFPVSEPLCPPSTTH
jgi:hypothetical protein